MNTFSVNNTKIEDFKVLYHSFYPQLMALACRFIDEYIAKDMVQEAFISLWEKEKHETIKTPRSYLYRSVQNNCLNYIKHNEITKDYKNRVYIAQARIEFESSLNENEIEKLLEHQDLRALIEITLEKLPPRCQEAFKLCYFHDLTYKEVAQIMNISHRTVEVHVQKALALLKEKLNPILLLLYISDFFL